MREAKFYKGQPKIWRISNLDAAWVGKIDTANDFFEAMRGILPGSSRDSHNDSQQRSY